MSQDLHLELENLSAPETVIPRIMEFQTRMVHEHPTAARLIWIAFVELGAQGESVYLDAVSPLFAAVLRYATRLEARDGRGLHPQMFSASLLTTALAHHALVETLAPIFEPGRGSGSLYRLLAAHCQPTARACTDSIHRWAGKLMQ